MAFDVTKRDGATHYSPSQTTTIFCLMHRSFFGYTPSQPIKSNQGFGRDVATCTAARHSDVNVVTAADAKAGPMVRPTFDDDKTHGRPREAPARWE